MCLQRTLFRPSTNFFFCTTYTYKAHEIFSGRFSPALLFYDLCDRCQVRQHFLVHGAVRVEKLHESGIHGKIKVEMISWGMLEDRGFLETHFPKEMLEHLLTFEA